MQLAELSWATSTRIHSNDSREVKEAKDYETDAEAQLARRCVEYIESVIGAYMA